ncbi:MAG: TadA family conjugal transfer-associated ATPase [Trueperella sp.]|nr:TadA family conjugal transfer-associated ATPase [Trueperella sp.]
MAELTSRQLHTIRRRLAAGTGLGDALGTAGMFTGELAALEAQVREQIGAGPDISPLLSDPQVTDVVVNGPQELWVDRGAGMEPVEISDPQLKSAAGVRALAVRLAAACGQRLDDASPIVDGTFGSGVRLHAVIPPLSTGGTLISLRTHRAQVLSLAQLVADKSVPAELAEVVRALVARRANVIISGATGAGKTTFLNTMLSMAAAQERILIIEEAAELAPRHPHAVHLQVRHANVQGAGEVSMSQLVRAAMRMRPDRIVLGECRGAEVRDVLGALNTGHEGGWATVHANSAADLPARLTALGALADMSEATVAVQAAAALDAVIHLQRRGSWRGISEIARLVRVDGELRAISAFRLTASGQVVAGPGAPALLERLGMTADTAVGVAQ